MRSNKTQWIIEHRRGAERVGVYESNALTFDGARADAKAIPHRERNDHVLIQTRTSR